MEEGVNILVEEKEIKPDGRTYVVYVGDGNNREEFIVHLGDDYWAKMTGNTISREDFVKKTFEFIMARESRDIILREFDVSAVPQYFPEFEDTVRAEIGR